MREGKRVKKMRKAIVGALLLSAVMVLGTVPVKAEAATEAQKEKVKQMMIDIFYSADTSGHNVLSYSLKTSEFDEIYEELQRGEHERMIGSYEHFTKMKAYSLGNRVMTIKLVTEDFEVLDRYKRVNENADAILAGIEPEMDDLDKVIYLHDAIVELVTYNKNAGDQRYSLGGALGDKNAVCLGYAEALNLLLKESGFETDCVISDSVNHAWSYVKLDGEWYHLDPTWDDTRSAIKGQTGRQFLLRNDAEFMAGGNNSHGTDMACEYGAPKSVSAKYSDWFMHDVVGKMAFEDGLWYFVDPVTKNIARADADGNGYETVVKYSGVTLAVVDMEGTELTYTEGGTTRIKKISEVGTGVTEDEVETEVDGIVGDDTIPEGSTEGDEEGSTENEPENVYNPTLGEGELGTVNLSDYNLWCEGEYTENSTICTEAGYFSTMECYSVRACGLYRLVMKDTRFRMEVFEYSEDGSLIKKTELESGDMHEMSAATCRVGLSMYMPIWKTLPYDELAKKMKYDLHSVEFTLEGVTETEAEEDPYERGECNYNSLEGVNLCDYNLWGEGAYNANGTFEPKEGYFSTQTCYQINVSETYTLTMKDTRFKLIVYEYGEDGRLLKATELVSGDSHEMSERTCHIGLSMYMPIWKNMPWDELAKKLKYNLHSVEFVKE